MRSARATTEASLAATQAYEAMQRASRGNGGGGAFPGAAAGGNYAVGTNQYAVSASGYPGSGYPGAQHGLVVQARAVRAFPLPDASPCVPFLTTLRPLGRGIQGLWRLCSAVGQLRQRGAVSGPHGLTAPVPLREGKLRHRLATNRSG